MEGVNEEVFTTVVNDQIEKDSYSDYSYKTVKKLRERGKLMGVDVPYLNHPVTKPEKPRALFLVLGIIFAALLVLVCVGIGYLTITTILPMILNMVGVTTTLTTRHVYDIFGIGSFIGTTLSFFLWVIVIVFVLFAIGIIVALVSITRKMFGLTKASVQEVAVGHVVANLIKNIILCIVIPIVLAVALLLLKTSQRLELF